MGNSNGTARETAKGMKDLLNLGLSGTNPIFINDTIIHDFEGKKGYILFILEDTVLNAESLVHMDGNEFTGITIGRGYYHVITSKIKLDSGSVIVYRAV